MTAVINAAEFPGFIPDGRPLDDVYEALCDYAYDVVAPANGNSVVIVLPIGAKIGLTRPTRRRSFNCNAVWRGAGGVGARSQTEFIALADLGGHMLHFHSFPSGEFTDITLRAEVEQSAGSLLHLEKCYRSKFRVNVDEGYRCISCEDGSGLVFDHCNTRAGVLQTPNVHWRGRPYRAGSYQWFFGGGGAGNNGITLEQCNADPILATEQTTTVEAAVCINSMDGLHVWGGHFAGGRYAHLLLQTVDGQPLNGVHFHGSWFDFFSARTVQVQGNGLLSNLHFHGGVLQGGYERNLSIENAQSQDIHLTDVDNELCKGTPAGDSRATYIANGTDVFIRGGSTRGNGRAEEPIFTAIHILKSNNIVVDQRVKGNNSTHAIAIQNHCSRVDISRSMVDGTVFDDGTNGSLTV